MIQRHISRVAPALLLGACLLFSCRGEKPKSVIGVSVVEMPEPVLDQVGPAVRRQIEEAQAGVAPQAIQAAAGGSGSDGSGTNGATLHDFGSAYGLLARTYHAYSFLEAADPAYSNARAYEPESFRWAYLQGVLRQELGRKAEAVADLDTALTLRPDDVTARVRRASILREMGDPDAGARARADLEQVLEERNDVALAHYLLGQIAADAGDWQQAAERFETVLELQPQASRVRYPLSRVYARLGRMDEAQTQAEQSGTTDVTLDDPLLAELAELRQGADSLVRRGAERQIAGDWQAAAAAYRAAVESDPENVPARMSLGGALAELGDLEGAETQLRRAVEIDPSQALAWYNLAGVLRGQGRLEEAISAYDEAITRSPGDVRFQLAKAQTQMDAGRTEAARRTYERLTSELGPIEAELGLARLDTSVGQGAVALRRLDALLANRDLTDDQSQVAHLLAADLRARTGDLETALDHYDAALAAFEAEIRPTDGRLPPAKLNRLAQAEFGRANMLGSLGRLGDAAKAYDRVTRLDPSRAEAWLGGATAAALGGDWAGARERLETGLEKTTDPARKVDLRHTLARLLATAPDAAVRDGELALELARAALDEGGPVDYAETVGMALAELGRWPEAVEWQQRVVQQLESAGQAQRAAAARALLAQYKREEPVRQNGPNRRGG